MWPLSTLSRIVLLHLKKKYVVFLLNVFLQRVKWKSPISVSAGLNILMCGPWEETFAAASHQVNHQDDLADDDDDDD